MPLHGARRRCRKGLNQCDFLKSLSVFLKSNVSYMEDAILMNGVRMTLDNESFLSGGDFVRGVERE